jgi:pimeloyl-ACP methyl ester carboxylesterase
MREVRFEVDGETVAGSLHEPAGETLGHVVLVHGLLSQRAEFGDAPARLAARGWRVLVIDQRGFGASGGERGIVTQERATADVLAAFDWLQREHGDAPEAVVGHSMGGLFALLALAARPSIRAGVLVAPMRSPRDEVSQFEYVAYRAAASTASLKRAMRLGSIRVPYKFAYEDLFADPEAARKAREAGFLATHLDLANVAGFLRMNAEEVARGVKKPVLVIIGEHDRVVKPVNSRRVYDTLAGPKELVTADAGHSMWTDRNPEQALDQADRWLRAHLAA